MGRNGTTADAQVEYQQLPFQNPMIKIVMWRPQPFHRLLARNPNRIITMRSRPATDFALAAIFVLALWLSASGSGHAQHAGPFGRLAGQWAGGGKIEMSDGTHERLRCRATYDVLSPQNAQLSIRCASDSYKFNITSSVTIASSAVTGTWAESAHNVAGELSGKASGERIHVVAKSLSFNATMSLVTRGNHQSVVIKSQDPQSSIKGVTLSLRRG